MLMKDLNNVICQFIIEWQPLARSCKELRRRFEISLAKSLFSRLEQLADRCFFFHNLGCELSQPIRFRKLLRRFLAKLLGFRQWTLIEQKLYPRFDAVRSLLAGGKCGFVRKCIRLAWHHAE